MARLSTSLVTGICGRILMKTCWKLCIRSFGLRPIPSVATLSVADHNGRKNNSSKLMRSTKNKREPLPGSLVDAIQKALAEFSVPDLNRDATKLNHYLCSRHPPAEEQVLQTMAQSLQQQYTNEHENVSQQKLKQFVTKTLKKRIYNWKPLEVLSEYEAAVYLVARLAGEYAALMYCLRQMASDDAAFRPAVVLHYGSGVGAGLWAARRVWPDGARQFIGIERRHALLELAVLLARGGCADGQLDPAVFFRPQLPASARLKFPLVVSSHALTELPSRQARLDTVAALWERTAPGGRLCLLEAGSNTGFQMVLEARQLVLRLNGRQDGEAHVEAPCPHDTDCPRFSRSLTPCHFSVSHARLPLSTADDQQLDRARLSYVTLLKAPRAAAASQWPRVVQPVLKRPRHIICRLCTSRGQLEEIVVTRRRHGADMYRCAKAAKWGDRLPVNLRDAKHESVDDTDG